MMTSIVLRRLASIHHQYVAVDVGGCVRCQKDRRAFQIMIGAKAARGMWLSR